MKEISKKNKFLGSRYCKIAILTSFLSLVLLASVLVKSRATNISSLVISDLQFYSLASCSLLTFVFLIKYLVSMNSLATPTFTDTEKETDRIHEINSDLEGFASMASHDLQAPVRHISSYAVFLQDELANIKLSPGASKYLDTIISSANKMKTLLDDLLVYSRLAPSSMNRNKIPVKKIIDHCNDIYSEELLGQKVKILCGEQLAVLWDEKTIIMLFSALITNSIKFKDPSRPLSIGVSAKELKNNWQIEVGDNGVGVDEKFHKVIFKAFKKLYPASSPLAGSGLGLALAKKIVDFHGGTIRMEKYPSRGAKIIFTIAKA